MAKLYELAQDYRAVEAMIDNEDTDIATIKDTMDAIEDTIEEKVVNIVHFIRDIDADASIIKAEEKRLAERRKSFENRGKAIKEYLQYNMELAGLDKIKAATVTIALQNNPPSVSIEDLTKIPSEFVEQRIDYVPDKAAIKKALQAGQEVPGATLSIKKSLRIR